MKLRQVLLSVPGVGIIETYPTIKSQRFHSGFEQVTLSVSHTIFEKLFEYVRLKRDPKNFLAIIYPDLPPIDPRDILNPLIDYEREEISFSIRRGHIILASKIKELLYDGTTSSTIEQLMEELNLQASSFPYYKSENENEQNERSGHK